MLGSGTLRSMQEGNRDLAHEIRDRMASSPFHSGMGIRVLDVREGGVDIEMDASGKHANLGGTLHGGVIATLADTAAGLAVRSAIEPGSGHVTVNLDVQYLRAGALGTVEAHGRVVRAGRSIVFAEAEVTGEDGAVLARAQVTVAISPPA
jgi:uncharacterized protein (TIGR00369 family)